jgi:glyoxylase-like metal-dependent hydrolase (beta-lactamase superfamily II)
MDEVASGIYLLRLPMPVTEYSLSLVYVNAYLVREKKGFTLVDSGWNTADDFDALQKQMAEIGSSAEEIQRIIITHVHPDHYGLAGRLKEISGAPLAIHKLEKDVIQTRYIDMDILLEQTDYWLKINGVPASELNQIKKSTLQLREFVAPVAPDITFNGGETLSTDFANFKILWTPGHSSGHICLYETRQKVLFAGDHVLTTITPNVGSHPQSIDNPLGRYLDSLAELGRMEIKLVLPGHEDPFTDLAPRIQSLTRHHQERLAQIIGIIGDKTKTAYEIAVQTPWGSNFRWTDMPFPHRRLAISETLSHLELLMAQGKAIQSTQNKVIYYRQN